MKAKQFIEKYNIRNFADFYAYLIHEQRIRTAQKLRILNEPLAIPSSADEYRFSSLLLMTYGDPRVDIVDKNDGGKDYSKMDLELTNLRKRYPLFDTRFYESHKDAVDEYIASVPDDYDVYQDWSTDWYDRSYMKPLYPEKKSD